MQCMDNIVALKKEHLLLHLMCLVGAPSPHYIQGGSSRSRATVVWEWEQHQKEKGIQNQGFFIGSKPWSALEQVANQMIRN